MEPIKNIQYHCGKVVEAAYNYGTDTDIPGLGLANLDLIEKKLTELLDEVQNRPSERKYQRDELHFQFELVKHAVSSLTNFLQNKRPQHEECLTAKLFATYLYQVVPDVVTQWQEDSTKC